MWALSRRRALVRLISQSRPNTKDLGAEEFEGLTHYQILGVQPSASKQDIRRAYLSLARKLHPDLQLNPSTEFSFIVQAYQTLSDDYQRAVYDESLLKPQDFYTLNLGPLKVSLKLLFLASLGCFSFAILSKPEQTTLDDQDCPSEHKVRRLGLSQQLDIDMKSEEPEVIWTKAARKPLDSSLRASKQSKGIFAKKDLTKQKDSSTNISSLPKQVSITKKQAEL
mmetsp:Transcript_10541/g.20272  ORF Transcript_10541/g.20272 Transcript_10541/m.20272 type:complete len:224 (-) Transcript_10541:1629-2300(-)